MCDVVFKINGYRTAEMSLAGQNMPCLIIYLGIMPQTNVPLIIWFTKFKMKFRLTSQRI